MLTRIGSPVASAIAAFVLAVALSGTAVGVALVADTIPLDDANAPAVIDTTATFEDLDGNGIDDDCQAEAAVDDAEAAAAARRRRSTSTRTARSASPRRRRATASVARIATTADT